MLKGANECMQIAETNNVNKKPLIESYGPWLTQGVVLISTMTLWLNLRPINWSI